MYGRHRTCLMCGHFVQPEWTSCRTCGAALRAPSARRSSPGRPLPTDSAPGTRVPSPAPTWSQARRRAALRSYLLWWVVVPAIIIVVIVLVLLAFSHAPLPATPTGTAVLVPQGTSFTIPSGSFHYLTFQLTVAEHVTGAFSSTTAVTAYLLTQSQALGMNTSGDPVTWTWSSGSVLSGAISAHLAVGDWYLDFVNPQGATSAVVTFTSALSSGT